MTTNRSKSPPKRVTAAQAPSLLVLAQPSPETDDLLRTLVDRTDICLLRVANLNAAEVALRDVAVSLVLVCPETDPEAVTAILDRIEDLRPGIPVLAFQATSDDPPPSWKGRIIGVLRAPILPDVLSRTVDVALGLSGLPAALPRSK